MKFRHIVISFFASLLGLLLLVPLQTTRGVSSTVVISEFRVRGPNGGSDEFVELYNLSPGPVNIGGWKIRGSNNAGTVSTRSTIAAGVTLSPGCYYLVTNSSTSGGPYSGAVLGNQTYGTGVTDDGGIALTLSDDSVVDAVGMSAGSAFKEGLILTSLGASNLDRGYQRKPGGLAGSGQDTDNNSADFQLISPSDPQNFSSSCTTGNDLSGSGTANPNVTPEGVSTLLTVTVNPANLPPSSGISVTADLTSISGSATQIFFDNATNGDAISGDNIFSFQFTIPAGAMAGAKVLPVSIADAQARNASTNISLAIPLSLAIHEIQGNASASTYNGMLVSTTGIVTARKFNGYFLQVADVDVDANPTSSEGIFVFTGGAPPAGAAVGNNLRVTATVQEFIPSADLNSPPLTELIGSSLAILSMGNTLPSPITITAADTDPAGSIEQLEKFEGMRVMVLSLTVIAPTQGNLTESSATSASNGVFYGVITGIPRPFREAGIQVPDPLPVGAPLTVPRFDANPERIRVDSDALLGSSAINVNTGAVVTNLTGPLDYGFRTYTIDPEPGAGFSGGMAFTAAPDPANNEFTVASFNLQRFFDTVNDPAVSDVVLTATAFNNRLNKASLAIRDGLKSPDILGVVEMENLSTLQALADKINNDAVAAGQANPLYVAYLEEGNDIGGIDVGFLVKTTRVLVNSVTQFGKLDTYINPISSLPETLNDRPPLVLDATVLSFIGPPNNVTVIVNHLRSLNGIDDPVDGVRVRAKRKAQAEFLANLVQGRQTANADEKIILVGDFNAFEVNDAYVDLIGTILGTPTDPSLVVTASLDLVDPNLSLLATFIPSSEQYSYVFDGNAQTLDHVMITSNLSSMFSQFHHPRLNADFQEIFRNDATRPERLSDHDPAVAYFRQNPFPVALNFFLHGAGPVANPSVLSLNTTSPTGATARYRDSASVKFAAGNVWKELGTWPADPTVPAGSLIGLSGAKVWLGLKNSDDQGTRFDLLVEVYKDGQVISAGEAYCIQGITRNPSLAKEVNVPLPLAAPVPFNGSSENLSLRIHTRIGTNGAGTFCGGHSNATGLRLYFDASDRAAQLGSTFQLP